MTNETRGQLRFRFADLMQEIGILREIATPYIAPASLRSLYQLSTDLDSIWSSEEGKALQWCLGDLWTVTSEGEYEPAGRKGARTIAACISGTWDVRPVGVRTRKTHQNRLLEFCGLASTRIRLFDTGDLTTPIAMWRMELGDAQSPGCYFHVQVLGEEDVHPFPKSVSVPRLPSIFVSPMGVVEFVLGELFQERWARTAMENTGDILRWAAFQKRRLLQLLDWHRETVMRTLTSPWIALKSEKPRASIFLD